MKQDHTTGYLSEPHHHIADYLLTKGYSITDYVQGYATDEKGKQQFKIGKLLKEQEGVYKKFMEDPVRTLGNVIAVISRNADDIARMSTGRAWGSCMGASGFNYKYVPRDIKQGTLIAYMISEKDPDITSPLARILLKPCHRAAGKLTALANRVFGHKNQDHIFVPDKQYGIVNNFFTKAIEQFVEEKLNQGKEGEFHLVNGLYQDAIRTKHIRNNKEK